MSEDEERILDDPEPEVIEEYSKFKWCKRCGETLSGSRTGIGLCVNCVADQVMKDKQGFVGIPLPFYRFNQRGKR